jgi:hypothetical protein
VEFRKAAFWGLALFGFFRFAALVFLMIIVNRFGARLPAEFGDSSGIIREFMIGQDFPIFIVMVLVGSGIIAKDAKANAMQVYLSKPVTRLDYFLGKFAALAIIVLMLLFVPGVIMFLLGWLTAPDGKQFLTNCSWMMWSIALYSVIAAAVFSTVVLGLSSVTKNARYAGVAMALVWFCMGAVAQILVMEAGKADLAPLSFSVSLGTIGRALFTDANTLNLLQENSHMAALFKGDWRWCAVSLALYCGAAIYLFWRRVRAVEIVK